MIARDSVGNPLAEGDVVLFPASFAQFLPANVVKLSAIVGSEPNAPQTVQIALNLVLGLGPDGKVPQVIKIGSAQPKTE